jgi:hypothetical protein
MQGSPNNPPSLYHGWLANPLLLIVMVNEAEDIFLSVVVTSMSKYW